MMPKLALADSLLQSNPKESISVSYQLLNKLMMEDCADSLMARLVLTYAQANVASLPKDSVYLKMVELMDKAKLSNNKAVNFQALVWLAQAYLDDGKFLMARKFAEDAVGITPEIDDNYQKARAYNVLGSILGFVGELSQAQENLIKAYKHFEQDGGFKALSAVYINIANNFIGLGDSKQAMAYYFKAKRTTLKHHDTLNYLVTLTSLGRLHTISDPDSAHYYFKRALAIGNSKWMIETLATRFEYANFLVERKLYDSAASIYNDVLMHCKVNNIEGGVYRALSGLGNVLEAKNKDEQALKMYQQARMLATNAGETPLVIELMNAERYMFEKMGDFRQGYTIMKRIKAMNDSLFSLEKQLSIHDLELFYQNEQVNLKNQKLQLSVREMKNRNYTIKIILAVAIGGLIALAGFLYVFYKLYRQRDIAYTALFEKYKYDTTVLPLEKLQDESIEQEPEVESSIHKLTLEIDAYFANSKPYLSQRLKVEDVAQKLGVTQKQVSAVLKATYGLHFNVFVNKYRIQEALELLANPDYQNIKIEHIAKQVGFGSKVSFYNAFAQITGSKPSDYRIF
jgi:AraC-like DNA-binding protein